MKNEYIVEYKNGFDQQGLPITKLITVNANAMKIENGSLIFSDSTKTIIYVFNMDVYVRAWMVK